MDRHYPWIQPYQEAIVETDHSKLPEKVAAAQAAIDARLGELSTDGHGASEERIAITDALNALMILRKELQRQA